MIDHLLWCRNRRVIAERCNWPADAVEMCERLERERPGWLVSWMAANDIPGWEHPDGYCASRDDVRMPGGDQMRPEDGRRRRPAVFGATPDELRLRIEVMQARIAVHEARQEAFYQWTRGGLG